MKRIIKLIKKALSPHFAYLVPVMLATGAMAQQATRYNNAFEGVVKPESTQRWLDFKEGTTINPNTIFVDYRNAFELSADDNMKVIEVKNDELGFNHYFYQQYYKNIKVTHGEFIVHQHSDGFVQSANGRLITGLNLNNIPAITETQALTAAMQFMNAKKYLWQNGDLENDLKRIKNDVNATYYPKGELVYAPSNHDATYSARDYRLCMVFDIYTDDPNVAAKRVFVDAITGAVVYHNDISMSCSTGTSTTTWNGTPSISTELSGGSYRSHNNCQTTDIYVYNCNGGGAVNTYYTDADNAWNATSQRSAAQAQYGARATYNYYNGTHSRLSWDGASGNMIAYNNAFAGSNNACWGCTGNSTIYYAGNTSAATDDWNTLDIMGHEFTHGVTQDEAGLVYNKESGALNESFSDIFGEMVESYNTGNCDYLVGGDRGAIRSFINPNSYNDPDTYNGTNYYTTAGCTPSSGNDNCGVHTNSSVQNRMFYLLSEGGSGTNDNGTDFSVSGITRFTARDIGYRALVLYLSGSDGFIDAREAWLRAAFDLFGGCSNEIIQVGNAWRAVGVESQSAQYNKNVCGNYPATATYAQAIHQLSVANGCATNITASATTVYFSARDRVVMYPGFRAISGSKFYAYIEPCAITLYKGTIDENRSDAEKGLKTLDETSTTVAAAAATSTLNIAPNPFKDVIDVTFKTDEDAIVSITLFDAVGKSVIVFDENKQTETGLQHFNYSTKNLKAGIYFINVTINGVASMKKIIKMN